MKILTKLWSRKRKRVLVIGLDGVPPEIAFEDSTIQLHNLRKLFASSSLYRMKTIIPPITVPAWICMMTGKTPGEIGIYGFRNRKPDYSYDLKVVTSLDVREKTLWDELSEQGYTSFVVGVPPSYPPKPLKGIMLSCFLTPDENSEFAYPPSLKKEIEKRVGKYMFDVRKFRTDDKKWLLDQIFELTEYRFKLYSHLLKKKEWDFFMFVEMGPDRMHHGFWKFYDKTHRKYTPDHELNRAMHDYYALLDEKIGKLLELVDDNTSIVVVSDHGAQKLDGGFCINEWLIENGFLKLKTYPSEVTRFSELEIDFENTVAWGEGGYYGRIFLNIKGREKNGRVDPSDAEKVKREIIEGLEKAVDPEGKPMGNKIYRPEDIYPEVKGTPPDLIAIFGNLYWRAIGSVGYRKLWTDENDTGPDDANHSWYGIFSIYDGKKSGKQGEISLLKIKEVIKSLF